MRRIAILLAGLVLAAALAVGASGSTKDIRLTLVAYSTPKEAYGKIISAFQKTTAGKDVSFDQSYGASGEQSRAVENGLYADVVAFSLEPDVTRLVKEELISAAWKKDGFGGMVTRSVVVFVVRDGNPKHIRSWKDLIKPGIQVVTPNPFTSGGARWNVMAAYGAQRKAGKTHKQTVSYLLNLFKHVVAQDKSARDALQTFNSGKGDVLIAYENEAIFANKKGLRSDYVVPRQTILIENPVSSTTRSKHQREARAFLRFLRSGEAQQIFADNGYRPVLKSVLAKNKFPKPPGLFTINKLGLGGWGRVQVRFFDRSKGIMAVIERQVGGSTDQP
jgi:sulfate/thiosulfate transport system substrate-binding protein